ncbi:MAG: COQ9 family protein [Robiginitomaculum sp.]|nr:COQ9 family protein [Robiginitomaculum sp.]
MKNSESQPHLDIIRQKLLPLVIKDAAFEGWTSDVLARATESADLHPGAVELALPRGCTDLIRFWAGYNDKAMLEAWEKAKPENMRIRDRAIFLVQTRIETIGEENKEAALRAVTRLTLPDQAGEALKLGWRTADIMWTAMGDTSTDYNYYTKRMILSGVFASTLMVWLQNDDDTAWKFLDRRIGNVMQFEGLKARFRKTTASWPDPAGLLGKLRYGRGRARARRM